VCAQTTSLTGDDRGVRPIVAVRCARMTSGTLVTYRLADGIATIAMDDGKVNALSPAMFAELGAALDRAQADGAAVVLTGRDGRFSAGFDLKTLGAGPPHAADLVLGGFRLAERLYGFPAPVVAACSGHALAMGVFLILPADLRIGAAGAFKLGANEVAIGLTMPYFALELCRHRVAPTHLVRVVQNAELFAPDDAVTAGLLDRVVPAGELADAARAAAAQLAALPRAVYAQTKQRTRADGLRALRAALEADGPRPL
jgi:enoyl-CoA hydratase